MIENRPERNELAYVERSGQWSRCIHESEVLQALKLLHNVHGHFSDQALYFQASTGFITRDNQEMHRENFLAVTA